MLRAPTSLTRPPRLTRQQPRPAGDPRGNNVESPLCEGCAPISERSDVQKVTGILRRVDCLNMTARFHVASGHETVKLYVDKPHEITLKNAPPGEFELRCGMQEELRVTVDGPARCAESARSSAATPLRTTSPRSLSSSRRDRRSPPARRPAGRAPANPPKTPASSTRSRGGPAPRSEWPACPRAPSRSAHPESDKDTALPAASVRRLPTVRRAS